VEGMSSEIDHLVETSTNLASVRTEGDCLTIVTSQRSSIDTAKEDIARRIRMVMETAGALVRHENSYPGWKPNSSSPIVEQATELYAALYGSRPTITAVHAGLECGVIGSKTEGMDMISFGPAMTGIHTPEERLNIPSVGRTYDFLIRLIKSL
jgi:dipeptidase D